MNPASTIKRCKTTESLAGDGKAKRKKWVWVPVQFVVNEYFLSLWDSSMLPLCEDLFVLTDVKVEDERVLAQFTLHEIRRSRYRDLGRAHKYFPDCTQESPLERLLHKTCAVFSDALTLVLLSSALQSASLSISGAGSLAGKKSAALCSTYGSSKFAIRCLTQSAASEWGRFGIRVNSYAPGLTNTPMLRKMDARIGDLMQAGPGAYIESMKPQTALGRICEPVEVANVVAFLASKEAAIITGKLFETVLFSENPTQIAQDKPSLSMEGYGLINLGPRRIYNS
ncbi:hypothetical protein BDQ17DRAFT_1437206 [Cyathus striatus]|nr:hypothetical protein BDQ17DRAFT_1437206 [Cyathus striatus]